MPTIWTIGHSTRASDEFLALLAGESISLLADVRRFPASRRHPQFNREPLEAALTAAGIGYRHFPALGGRRSQRLPDSPNTAWRVESFNAYADHMQSAEFQQSLAQLVLAAQAQPAAIMCAEALPWQCHRRLIADALIAADWEVLDIVGSGKAKPHALTEFARVEGRAVTYPAALLF